jgi:excisionase family DNA binding protein
VLLTVKDLAEQLQIKPATLYAWAAQNKIPCLKIHGVVRFEATKISDWLNAFTSKTGMNKVTVRRIRSGESVEALIARAKREVYSSPRGNQTNSEPNRKEEAWGS